MSRLYMNAYSDTIRTNRTCCGRDMISAHVRGWESGVSVRLEIDDNDNLEYVVHISGGSNGITLKKVLTLTFNEDGDLLGGQQVLLDGVNTELPVM